MKKDAVQITKPEDVPAGPHFAIIKYVEIVGDDGWGGTRTEKAAEHWVTEDREVWEMEISRLTNTRPQFGGSHPKFVAFKVAGLAKVERKVSVTI